MSWNCSMCSHFAAPTLKAVIRHIGAVHSHDAFFHVYCGIEGCPRTYKSFHSYKKHMYLKHRDILDISQPAIPPPINPVTATAMENPDMSPHWRCLSHKSAGRSLQHCLSWRPKKWTRIHNPVWMYFSKMSQRCLNKKSASWKQTFAGLWLPEELKWMLSCSHYFASQN